MKYGKVADMDREPMTIADLGYDDFFEAARVKARAEGVVVARVIAEHRGAYRVRAVGGDEPRRRPALRCGKRGLAYRAGGGGVY